jgi:hypothetical protein
MDADLVVQPSPRESKALRTPSSAASWQDVHDKEGDDDDGRRDSDDPDGGDG